MTPTTAPTAATGARPGATASGGLRGRALDEAVARVCETFAYAQTRQLAAFVTAQPRLTGQHLTALGDGLRVAWFPWPVEDPYVAAASALLDHRNAGLRSITTLLGDRVHPTDLAATDVLRWPPDALRALLERRSHPLGGALAEIYADYRCGVTEPASARMLRERAGRIHAAAAQAGVPVSAVVDVMVSLAPTWTATSAELLACALEILAATGLTPASR